VTRTLAFFLKPGGTLLVADFTSVNTKDNVSPDEVAHIVPHRAGLSREDIEKAFTGAALVSFSFETVASGRLHGMEVDFFLAKGVKASTTGNSTSDASR
jgi:hypothetical protein